MEIINSRWFRRLSLTLSRRGRKTLNYVLVVQMFELIGS